MINIQLTVNNEYCLDKMKKLGITIKDICTETGLSYHPVYQYIGGTKHGNKEMSKTMKVAMYYFFLSKEV